MTGHEALGKARGSELGSRVRTTEDVCDLGDGRKQRGYPLLRVVGASTVLLSFEEDGL